LYGDNTRFIYLDLQCW